LNAAGSQQSVSQLNRGLKDLHQGATELSTALSNAATGAIAIQTGAQQLNDNVVQLTQSAKTLGAGLRQMENSRPRSADLRRLDTGADALANGVGELGQGLQQLSKGSRALSTQVSQFKEESDSSFLISTTDKSSVTQAAQGVEKLDQGLHTAVDSGQKLEEGAKNLRAGVNKLTAGVRGMNNALRTVVGQFPQDAQLDTLDSGTAELALGTSQMAQGTEKLSSASKRLQMGLAIAEKAIPDMGEAPEGSPEGLADSVRPVLEMDAAVQNNGIGFIANVIPAALWLGAGIAAFVVNLRSLPKQAKSFHPLAQWAGKLLLPAGLVVLQCLLVLFTVFVVLQVNVVNPWALTCTILSAGLAFLCVINALTCFMGDAGKATAMVLLALQMTSSGGVMPVELSGSFFATLSPWLPITWLAHGLKASLFGAYEGAFTVVFGRWRYVPVRQLKPQLDL
jgi:putative membrane protein